MVRSRWKDTEVQQVSFCKKALPEYVGGLEPQIIAQAHGDERLA